MARIHVSSGTPGLLTELGEDFLAKVYYRGLLESTIGRAFVIEIGDAVAGFVTSSPDSTALFGTIFRARLVGALGAILKASLRRPTVLLHFMQSVLVVRRPDLRSDVAAEIVSLEVAPRFQGMGLGLFLLDRAVEDLQSAGLEHVKARVLADQSAVVRLYEHLGFTAGPAFTLQGRAWSLMVRDHGS